MPNNRIVTLLLSCWLVACTSPRTMNSPILATASISNEIDDPKSMFSSLAPLPAGEELAAYGYQAYEYFISGLANGEPYKTRVVIRQPVDLSRFQGLVMTEATHPSGKALVFHFNHRYLMDSGFIGIDIYTNDLAPLQEHDPLRYGDMRMDPQQRSEILAQVGALLKSDRPDNPLAGIGLRKMILTGTSASSVMIKEYLPTHINTRLSNGDPIFDGFLPTSSAVEFQPVDVPLIQVSTITEIERGLSVQRLDSDTMGEQYRLYETAGIAHLDSRDADSFVEEFCAEPVSKHPFGTAFSTALDHLFQWVDQGISPPRAERIVVDGDTSSDGSLMALDEYGNAQGGLPSPYVNVPVAKYGAPNVALETVPDTLAFLCTIAGYQHDLTQNQLRSKYGSKENYLDQVQQEVNRLISQRWLLPIDAALVLSDAEQVEF